MNTITPRLKPRSTTTQARVRPRHKLSTADADSAEALGELSNWLQAGKLPELIPTRQERSLRTALALVEAGRTLLHDHALEDVSVEMLCQSAGTTVGAFYGRFENKHAFFVTMQRLQLIRSSELAAGFGQRHRAGNSTVDDLCEDIVNLTVQSFRANEGVLRASLQHTREGMWKPFRQLGDRYRVALAAKLAPHLTHLPPAQRKLRVLFAYQALTGTMVHAVLNNPGPLELQDDALVGELTRLVKSYLAAPP